MFECWHILFCEDKVENSIKNNDNLVNVINEVKVDNKDAETWLAIIACIQLATCIVAVFKVYQKSLKKIILTKLFEK